MARGGETAHLFISGATLRKVPRADFWAERCDSCATAASSSADICGLDGGDGLAAAGLPPHIPLPTLGGGLGGVLSALLAVAGVCGRLAGDSEARSRTASAGEARGPPGVLARAGIAVEAAPGGVAALAGDLVGDLVGEMPGGSASVSGGEDERGVSRDDVNTLNHERHVFIGATTVFLSL